MFKKVDENENDYIDYQEFLVAMVDLTYLTRSQKDQLLLSAFNTFAEDGTITRESLIRAFTKFGLKPDQEELDTHFANKDGMTLNDFRLMVLN